MKKLYLLKCFCIFSFLLFGTSFAWAQASLPFSYDGGNPGVTIPGLTATSLAADGTSSPKMRLGSTGSSVILNFSGTPGVLSFKIKWIQATAAARFPGEFSLQESADGVTYTIVQTYNSTIGTALTSGTTITETFTSLQPTTRYVKWVYNTKTNGNIYIGAINLSAGSLLSVSPKTLNGFTYIFDRGPSSEQSFVISGTKFTHDISVTPSANYEISTFSGSQFKSTNPIVLTPTDGAVSSTSVFVRLKSGLALNSYNEAIAVSSIDASTQSVICSGSVTPIPVMRIMDMSNIAMNAIIGKSNVQTLNVSAVNLNQDLSLALTGADANQFSLSHYSLPLASDKSIANTILTITYQPKTVGNHTATLLISSSGAMDVSRVINGVAEVNTELDKVLKPLNVSVVDGQIVFTANVNDVLQIYNSMGQKILQKLTSDGVNKIAVPAHGVLLVKFGSQVTKVML